MSSNRSCLRRACGEGRREGSETLPPGWKMDGEMARGGEGRRDEEGEEGRRTRREGGMRAERGGGSGARRRKRRARAAEEP